jgi:predicted DNA binding protein
MSILGLIERKSGVYMYGLFELQEGRLKLSYLGNTKQVKDFLKGLQAAKIRHNILSLTDARFSPDSPLYSLTEKQRRVLISAFKHGYFEIPRRLSFIKLSQLSGLGRSTVNEHLRKAESRLISVLLSEQ